MDTFLPQFVAVFDVNQGMVFIEYHMMGQQCTQSLPWRTERLLKIINLLQTGMTLLERRR